MPMLRARLLLPLLASGLLACELETIEPAPTPPPGQTDPIERPPNEMPPDRVTLSPEERLGKFLFFDKRLSEPPGQSCAACHVESTGWTGPDPLINLTGSVYEGAVPGRFGNRKPLASAYATPAPVLHLEDAEEALFVGGNFWDGRATGERLGNPAADQAQGPFLNPVEQNNPSAEVVVQKVCSGPYVSLFRRVYGPSICEDTQAAYDSIALAIAAYEGSREVSPYSSRYDAWLAGRAHLTAQEQWGLKLFEGKAQCSGCHPNRPGPRGEPPLFTDYTYDNLGVPRNPLNPWYWQFEFNPLGPEWVDFGLGAFLYTRPEWQQYAWDNLGKVRVPTLRNVDKRPYPTFPKAYMHNGVFKTLEAVVHFYNTRDVLPVCQPGSPSRAGVDCWPPPEVPWNVNTTELGRLGLTPQEEAALVAFLKTLSDGYSQR